MEAGDDDGMFVVIVGEKNDYKPNKSTKKQVSKIKNIRRKETKRKARNTSKVKKKAKKEINKDDMCDSDVTFVPELESEEDLQEERKISSKKSTSGKRKLRLLPSEQKSIVQDLRDQDPMLANNEALLIEKLSEEMLKVTCPTPPDDFATMLDNDSQFACGVCGEQGQTKTIVRRHWQKKHGPRYLICFACGVDFRDDSSLYRHERRCVAPDANIVLKARALGHEVKGTNIGRQRKFPHQANEYRRTKSFIHLLCEQNPELGENKELLIKKLRKMMRDERAPDPPDNFCVKNMLFECTTCDAKKHTYGEMTRHWQDMHGPRYLTCYACGWDFREPSTLYKHERRCNAPDAKIVLEARNGVERPRGRAPQPKDGTGKQKDMKPKAKKKRYECSQCPAVYINLQSLQSHERAHTGARPYRCQMCPAAYTSAHGLSRHKMSHQAGPFICQHCACVYKTKESLAVHLKTHLPNAKLSCPQCDKQYSSKMALRIHVDRDHNKLPPPCACHVCPKRYPRMSLLKDHMLKKHGMHLITRNMFYRQLPYMPDTQINQAIIVTKSNLAQNNPCVVNNQQKEEYTVENIEIDVDVEGTMLSDQDDDKKDNDDIEDSKFLNTSTAPGDVFEADSNEDVVKSDDHVDDNDTHDTMEMENPPNELLKYVEEHERKTDERTPFIIIKDGRAAFVDGNHIEYYTNDIEVYKNNLVKDATDSTDNFEEKLEKHETVFADSKGKDNVLDAKTSITKDDKDSKSEIAGTSFKGSTFQGEIISKNKRVVTIKNCDDSIVQPTTSTSVKSKAKRRRK